MLIKKIIGCNTGEAIVGNMGPIHRFEFSMMGPNVNLAACCESMAEDYGVFTMITEYTQSAAVESNYDIVYRYLGKTMMKNRQQPVSFYEPVGFKDELPQYIQDCLDFFGQGIEKYLDQDWDGALEAFKKAKPMETNQPHLTPGVEKNPSMVFIERCQEMKNPPGTIEWNLSSIMKDSLFSSNYKLVFKSLINKRKLQIHLN